MQEGAMTVGLCRRVAGLLAALVLSAAAWQAASAAEPVRGAAEGTVDYRVVHSRYDEIGSHKVTFSRKGDDLVVEVALNIKVKFLFVTLHSLSAERKEVWRGGRFVGYSSHTDDNGTLYDIVAHAERHKLLIEGPDGKAEADGSVFPTHPWNPEIVNHGVLMDTMTGKLLKVSVAPAGTETVEVAGKPVETAKYKVTGDLERELWYDADGNWIQLRFPRDGATLTFTRITPL
jgi:hypothetical protein